jgi:hypothetical protein
MPFEISKKGMCYSVVNTDTGRAHSKCSTKANAMKQMKLLYGVESGWKPSSSYREFVKREFQKRPAGVSASAYMKTIGDRWKQIQSKK